MDYFVIGLPRSKTAWMSNYLTYENSLCLHEGIFYYGLNGLLTMVPPSMKLFGNSDPSNLFVIEHLLEVRPNAKWVYIERDIEDCRKSASKVGVSDKVFNQMLIKLRMFKSLNITNNITIPFDFSIKNLQDLNSFLGIPFSKTRAESLMKLNVQIDDKILEAVRRRRSQNKVLSPQF